MVCCSVVLIRAGKGLRWGGEAITSGRSSALADRVRQRAGIHP